MRKYEKQNINLAVNLKINQGERKVVKMYATPYCYSIRY